MEQRVGVFDVWVYRKDPDAVRYLLLRTSQEKADRWFNGGRFWQIPSDVIGSGESLVHAVQRCLGTFGIKPASIWAAEHAYTIYNRRFDEIQVILVFAAEWDDESAVQFSWEHSEFAWCTAVEAENLVGYRGLKEGLLWVRRYVTEEADPLPELLLDQGTT